MSKTLEIYENKYNTKYGSNCKFFGNIKVFQSNTNNNDYCVSVFLSVYENNEQQYAFSQEIFIKDAKSYTNKNIKMGKYELIGIIDDLESLSNFS